MLLCLVWLWHNILLLFDTCLHCVVMNACWAIPHSAPLVMFDMTARGLCFLSQAKKGDTWYLSDLPTRNSANGLQLKSKCFYSKWIGKLNPISLFRVLYILTRIEQQFSIRWIPSNQDHLWMNIAPDLNNHLRSIDLLRSMIIKKNRSKVRDSHWILIG